MKSRLGLISLATGTLMLAAATACGGSSPRSDPPGSPSPRTSTSTAAPATATPTAPAEAAAAQASELVQRYFAVLDDLGQNPASKVNALASVATGTELRAEESFFRDQHRRGERQLGDTRVAVLKVQSVSLGTPGVTADGMPTVVVDACWDVSKVDVVDRRGKSIVGTSRPDTTWTRYVVTNDRSDTDPGGWRVASGRDLKQAPCTGS